MRPGINVRPPPSMICVLALRSVGMGAVEMRSILLPRTSTLLGPESVPDFPSKTRTFWKSTIVGCTSWAIKRNEIKTVTTTRVAPSCLHFGRIGFPQPIGIRAKRGASSESGPLNGREIKRRNRTEILDDRQVLVRGIKLLARTRPVIYRRYNRIPNIQRTRMG